MSHRETIAGKFFTNLQTISQPDIAFLTRQPFDIDELSEAQFPAVVMQTGTETRVDQELGPGSKRRICTLEFVILGFVKGADDNIDTLRNALIEKISNKVDSNITHDGNALDSMVTSVETDEGQLFPRGGIRMVVEVTYDQLSSSA